eukprot:jgi/Mesvir1/27784/Mv07466-RA.1
MGEDYAKGSNPSPYPAAAPHMQPPPPYPNVGAGPMYPPPPQAGAAPPPAAPPPYTSAYPAPPVADSGMAVGVPVNAVPVQPQHHMPTSLVTLASPSQQPPGNIVNYTFPILSPEERHRQAQERARVEEEQNKGKGFLSKLGKRMEKELVKLEDTMNHMHSHLKASDHAHANVFEAAVGKLSTVSKIAIGGGTTKTWRELFQRPPEENLRNYFACSLHSSGGGVGGVLYVGTLSIAFASDRQINFIDQAGNQVFGQYKVLAPLRNVAAFNRKVDAEKPAVTYIQALLANGTQLWFTGFVNYELAVYTCDLAMSEAPYYEGGGRPPSAQAPASSAGTGGVPTGGAGSSVPPAGVVPPAYPGLPPSHTI